MTEPFSVEWSLEYFEAADKKGLKTPAHRSGAVLAAEVRRLREIEFRMQGLEK